jgi:hypothetical protein
MKPWLVNLIFVVVVSALGFGIIWLSPSPALCEGVADLWLAAMLGWFGIYYFKKIIEYIDQRATEKSKFDRKRILDLVLLIIPSMVIALVIISILYDSLRPKKSFEYIIYSKDTLSATSYLVTDGDTAVMRYDNSDLRKGYDTIIKNKFYSN